MRPSLESVCARRFSSIAAEEIRVVYAPTPLEVCRLFTKDPAELAGDGWLVEALHAGAVRLFDVPSWVEQLVTIHHPTIEIYPSKSPGVWRLNANAHEWYVHSEDLARTFHRYVLADIGR